MNHKEEQLLTQSEVAAIKDMDLSLLAYHLGKPGAPLPEIRYGKKLYRLSEVNAWKPKRLKRNSPSGGGRTGSQK